MDWVLIKMNAALVVLLIIVTNKKTRPEWLSKKFGITLVFLLALLMNGSILIHDLSHIK